MPLRAALADFLSLLHGGLPALSRCSDLPVCPGQVQGPWTRWTDTDPTQTARRLAKWSLERGRRQCLTAYPPRGFGQAIATTVVAKVQDMNPQEKIEAGKVGGHPGRRNMLFSGLVENCLGLRGILGARAHTVLLTRARFLRGKRSHQAREAHG